jgi:hypothetical protein
MVKPIETTFARENIDILVSLLREIRDKFEISHDSSFVSSPIAPLLTKIGDDLILAADLMREGSAFFGRRNRLIKFIEEEKVTGKDNPYSSFDPETGKFSNEFLYTSDPLGNPKQVVFSQPDTILWDPGMADKLTDMAQEIFDFLRGFSPEFPKAGSSGGKTRKVESPKLRQESFHYYRRRRNRKDPRKIIPSNRPH